MAAMHVESVGKNSLPTLMMLHGWASSSDVLHPLATLMKDKAHTLLVDLPGFGRSEPPQEVWSAFDYADALVAYMNETGLSKVNLLGHSFGGKVAMSLAIRYPERLGKLILICPAGLKHRYSFANKCRHFAIRTANKFIKIIDKACRTNFHSKYFAPRFGSKDYLNSSGILRSILVKHVNEDYTNQLSRISAPTLILSAEHDKVTPPETAQRLHQGIRRSKLHIFPEKDHFPFQDVGSHLCARYIKEFLSEES